MGGGVIGTVMLDPRSERGDENTKREKGSCTCRCGMEKNKEL